MIIDVNQGLRAVDAKPLVKAAEAAHQTVGKIENAATPLLGGAQWRQCQAGLTAAKLGVGRHGQAASTLGGMRPVAVVLVCLLE